MTNATAAINAPAAPAAEAAPQAQQSDAGAQALANAASAAAPQQQSNGEWYSGIQNETTRTWAQAKGWKDPLAAVESAYNLEKLIGFDKAGRTVVIPGDDATPEQRAAYNSRIGVPENAEGYKLPVPEGMDDAFSKQAANWFHKHGIPAKAGEGIVSEYNSYVAAQQAQQEQARTVQSEQDLDQMRGEWGQAFNERIEISRRGLTEFLPAGTPEERTEMMDKLESAMGTKNFLKFAHSLGAGLGEHKLHQGSNSGLMTPAQASQKIAELKSNKEWTSAYLGGDKVKAKELQDLISMANPSES